MAREQTHLVCEGRTILNGSDGTGSLAGIAPRGGLPTGC